jgi:peptidyl-tRNA hydrolase, PTH1 family
MKLIVGLGNPGEKYAKTRHNVGFMVIDELAQKLSKPNSKFSMDSKSKGEILKCNFANVDLLFVKPQTMMNASGETVAKLKEYYRVNSPDIWVIHDDLDLPLGHLKIVIGHGSAGHHGVDSIIKELGNENFVRFRIGIDYRLGIGVRVERKKVEEYVIHEPKGKEAVEMAKGVKKAVEAVEFALKEGIDKAMNRLNG